jgi:hypothetical protein
MTWLASEACGRYVVGQERHVNKFLAYCHAFSLGGNHVPHWDYYESWFGQFDWAKEPKETLSNLYRARAQDLRSRYDQVIIWFSGGADSFNAIDSFVSNNIPLDGIWIRAPFEYFSRTDRRNDPENLPNEIRYVAIPTAKKFQERDPRIDLRVMNYMDVAIEEWSHGPIDITENNYLGPCVLAKAYSERVSPKQFNRHETVVKINGIDKPRLIYEQGKFYFAFLDQLLHAHINERRTLMKSSNETDEPFYWHPHCAKLLIKQCHVIKNWFQTNPKYLSLLSPNISDLEMTHYYEIVKKLIYPTWDPTTWQVDKNRNYFNNEQHSWFYTATDHPAYVSWKKTLDTYSNEIQSLYHRHNRLDDPVVSLKDCGTYKSLRAHYSKFYLIG